MTENEISKIIFDCGMKVHRKIGVGLYENFYEQCLEYELKKEGLKVERQKDISVNYEDLVIEKAFRVDMLIEDKVIIENKATPEILDYYCSAIELFKNYKSEIRNDIELSFTTFQKRSKKSC